MKIGNLIRYRDRVASDPPPPGTWGHFGIVVELTEATFQTSITEPAIVYLNGDGHFIIARTADVRIVNEDR